MNQLNSRGLENAGLGAKVDDFADVVQTIDRATRGGPIVETEYFEAREYLRAVGVDLDDEPAGVIEVANWLRADA